MDNIITRTNGLMRMQFILQNILQSRQITISVQKLYVLPRPEPKQTITAVGFSENLNLYAANSFPTSRAGLSAITIATAASRTNDFTTAQGMMAGKIAAKFNSGGRFGVEAAACNNLELFGISNGRLQFDIFGDNATACRSI